ncbi:MAG: flagellar biosynthesis protein FliQ [Gammaproteobacteria bacterium]|nr:flagellar biosynthesis protein FliQ [Gammaproteobacteria bacterium]
MTSETILTIGQKMLEVVVLLSIPLLLPTLIIGLLVGMFQAATQINEMTLSFIPKLVAIVVVLVFFGPWLLNLLVDFSRELILSIPEYIG